MSSKPAVVHSEPEILGGTLVFVGTRVPFQTLLDYLEAGDSLDKFLIDYPTVTREQAVTALEQAKEALLAKVCPERAPNQLEGAVRKDVPEDDDWERSLSESSQILEALADEALDEHRAGRTPPLKSGQR